MTSPYYAEAFHPVPKRCFPVRRRRQGRWAPCPLPGIADVAWEVCCRQRSPLPGGRLRGTPRIAPGRSSAAPGFRKGAALPVTRRRVSTITEIPSSGALAIRWWFSQAAITEFPTLPSHVGPSRLVADTIAMATSTWCRRPADWLVIPGDLGQQDLSPPTNPR